MTLAPALSVGAGHARPARQPTFEASMSSTPISTPK